MKQPIGVYANPLKRLRALGQSIWLDDIRRSMLRDGELARLIGDDGVSGVTSNPAIFEKSIAHSNDYDAAVAILARAGHTPEQIYEALVVDDVRSAADLLRGIYDAGDGADGYVSLEVSPHLAHDADATYAEAQRLWRLVDRPNLMVKVPATSPGIAAFRQLIGAGVNVNVTLLFGVAAYHEVLLAYVSGLEDARAAGVPLRPIASVASFFLSRIDTKVDAMLDRHASAKARGLRGQVATACARIAYMEYKRMAGSARWRALEADGARLQRLLWASTSTKDPRYPDTKYVEALIGPHTVNTMPLDTLIAYRDHGDPAPRLADDYEAAVAVPLKLAEMGIDLALINTRLEQEAIEKFVQPYDSLIATLARRAVELR